MMELTAKSIVAHYGHVRDLKVKNLSLAILYCAGVLHVYNAVVTLRTPLESEFCVMVSIIHMKARDL